MTIDTIELTLGTDGDTRSWSPIKERTTTHVRTTIALTNDQAVVNHLRVSSFEESGERKIYDLLGVRDPLKRTKTRANDKVV